MSARDRLFIAVTRDSGDSEAQCRLNQPREVMSPGAPPLARADARASSSSSISFLILFFELACIRWLGSTVIFLTFFTNIVLMACFLGVSVGCLAASRDRSWIRSRWFRWRS